MVLLLCLSTIVVHAAENIPHEARCTIEISLPDDIKKLLKEPKTTVYDFNIKFNSNDRHQSINVYQSMFMAFTRKQNKGSQESSFYLGNLYERLQDSFKKQDDSLQFDEGYCLTCNATTQKIVELHLDRVHFNNERINYVWHYNIDNKFHKCKICPWNIPLIEKFKIGEYINEFDNTVVPGEIIIKITPTPIYNHVK